MRKSICEGKYNKRPFSMEKIIKCDNEFMNYFRNKKQNTRFDLFLRTKTWAKLNFQTFKLFSPH